VAPSGGSMRRPVPLDFALVAIYIVSLFAIVTGRI
jgi:hypothetical protein